MDVVQQTYGLNQNDQPSTDHQITKYLSITCSDSKSIEKHHNLSSQSTGQSLDLTINESRNSPKSDIKCSNDKLKQDFSQIKLLSNSFNTIINDKENLNYYHQYSNTNNNNKKNKSFDVTDYQSQETDHFTDSFNSSTSCTSTSDYIQIQEDITDNTDKEELESRRKRRKQILPQQNFHFTPVITNNKDDLMEVNDTSNENELIRFIDCKLDDSMSYQPKIRKLSNSSPKNDVEHLKIEELEEVKGKEHTEENIENKDAVERNSDIHMIHADNDHELNQTDKSFNKSFSHIINMNSECNKLINELSQYAIEAFRQSLTIKSTKLRHSLDNEMNRNNCNDDIDDSNTTTTTTTDTTTTNDNDNTDEKIIEQTLLKLEPHITELVDQSLRTSIETIKKEMLANFKEININLNNSNNDSLNYQYEINKNNKNNEKLQITNNETLNETTNLFKYTTDINDNNNNKVLTCQNLIQSNSELLIKSNLNHELKQNNQFIDHLKCEKIEYLTNHFKQYLNNLSILSINTNNINNNNNLIKQINNNNNINLLINENIEKSKMDSNNLSNIITYSNDSIQSDYKTLLKLPNNNNNLTLNSIDHHINIDDSTCNVNQNDSNNCMDTTHLNEQIIPNVYGIKENFSKFSSYFSNINENNQIYSRISSNDLSMIDNNSPPSSTQSIDCVNFNQSVDINSSEIVTSSMLTNTTTSTSPSCNPVTAAAAAAAALANVLGFPIPYGWSPKTLTDVQDAYGLLSNPYYHWPWKLLNSPYASKYSDQNTLLQSSSLVNNTMNIIEQMNKVNPESTLDSCLKSKFPLNDENKQNNIMMFNDATSLSTHATSSDEQVEAIPLIVRHDRKVNKPGSVINCNSTIYNSCSSNLTTSTNVTTAPITNESNSFHGPTISRRRRTKVTDTRLTHSRVSRCPNNAYSNLMMTNSVMHQNNRHHHNQPISQQQSFLQSTSESNDLGQALNLVTSTSTSFGLSGNQLLTNDKESLITSQSLLPGINPAKYCDTVVSTCTTTCSNINNTSNVKLDDFYSAKYRSENQIHSSGSNNSSPSPISLRLSGYSKELTDNTSENPKGHCHENVDILELDKNIDYQRNGADEKLHCLNILQEYKSFEKMFAKTLKNYPLSAKSNLLNNIGTLPAVMNTVSSSAPPTYSPSVFKDINTSLEVTTSASLSISSTFPTSSSTTSVPVTSLCSSACSDINQRKLLSRFNQICMLNSRLPNSLPPIPPMFFNPTEDTINNNFNHISNNNTNNTNKFSTGNFYDYTSIQSDGHERQQQSLSHSFGAKNDLSYSHPHNLSLSSSLPCKSLSPYSQSLKSSIFSPSQSLASVIGSIDYNTAITTAANNSIDHNNYNNITTISSLQNKHQRLQQNLPNLNSKRHHNHMSYINKLYDKFNANENLRNIKLDKSLLLNDNFSGESTSGMTISESYQNQLINYSHELRMTTTLTPVHLRKAKLMFFYTRYPNSTLIKMYFPDVKFYKNNTAQLVKWFSNFREFYYIQMEKYARVAISEGIRIADEIHVTIESEIYRALNLHYNRNQQLEVPDHFRIVVEATLREFFNALYTGKDSEQSWKKPIYKVIARMDQPVPEFFKSPNWMDQLADG
ncbi:unnamed protein product [Schistosoma rodhaini]|nr:unnamed protein product [Schistosoma rodhaini]CAH8682035.1 unnamed protein product [Schistosoma rodhaini]